MIEYAIIASIGVIILIVALFIWKFKNKEKVETDYRVFFIIGISWLPLGIVFMNTLNTPVFFILGIIFFIIGIANKDKWKKQEPIEKNTKIAIAIGVIILVLLIIFAALITTGAVKLPF